MTHRGWGDLVGRLGLPLVAACGLGWSPGALAQEPWTRQGQSAAIQTMDADGDGALSAQEYAAGAESSFRQLDADHDGAVTAAELDTATDEATGMAARSKVSTSADHIAALDNDGNGVLSVEENEAGARDAFAAMDANGDGLLDSTELAVARPRPAPDPQAIRPPPR
jgi:Ca2+-binding EF-hand superfamily protein